MNYELANELKEVGFPQGGKGTWTLPPDSLVARRADRVYSPTLEELIEACGRAFRSLTWQSDGRWDAFIYGPIDTVGGTNHIGATPTEAVARLWLTLNKKV